METLPAIPPSRPPMAAPNGAPLGLTYLPTSSAQQLAELQPSLLPALLDECRAVIRASEAAPAVDFAVQIERLALHYPESRLTRQEQGVVLKDWRRLLGHLPTDILAEAVDEYLLSPARFFPTPGQLDAIAGPKWRYRQLLARRAREVRALVDGGAQ